MAKLLQFWFNRNKPFRVGMIWFAICQLIRIPYLYTQQYIGFPNLIVANAVDMLYKLVCVIQIIFIVVAVFGIAAEIHSRRANQ